MTDINNFDDLENEKGNLRPKNLLEFIGQIESKDNLTTFIRSASKRQEAMDHALLVGPPGLGKTTLAQIIANDELVSYDEHETDNNQVTFGHHDKIPVNNVDEKFLMVIF